MRVLVTRPADQAAPTVKRLSALGHSPVCAPALEIVPIVAVLPEGPFDLILATSAQAFAGLRPSSVLGAAPLACVGDKTAAAAATAGFTARIIAPRAEALSERLIAEWPPGSALYLAGRERKPLLEDSLRAAGWRLAVLETYDARPVESWPAEIVAALEKGEVDAILHYSPRSAAAARVLIGTEGAARLSHYCLSEDVAAICRTFARAEKIFVASQPDEEALMTLVGPSSRLARSDRA
jgi:uroporphyrinogen-III synthase